MIGLLFLHWNMLSTVCYSIGHSWWFFHQPIYSLTRLATVYGRLTINLICSFVSRYKREFELGIQDLLPILLWNIGLGFLSLIVLCLMHATRKRQRNLCVSKP